MRALSVRVAVTCIAATLLFACVKQNQAVVVPNVVGMSSVVAEAKVTALGLNFNVVHQRHSPAPPARRSVP
jgi:beta-lactam-binding protein with PASTA domain